MISADNRVLDGHHRWLALRELGWSMEVVRIDLSIQDLLEIARKFPKVQVVSLNQAHSKRPEGV